MSDRERAKYCDRDITPCYGRDIAGVEEITVEDEIRQKIKQLQNEMEKNYPHNAIRSNNTKVIYHKPYNQMALRKAVKKAVSDQKEKESNKKVFLMLVIAILIIIGIVFITLQFQ